jgi:hypothetical protein
MDRLTFNCPQTPPEIIRKRVEEKCPDGYPMSLPVNSDDAKLIRQVVNVGIDSHLEAITNARFATECTSMGSRLHCVFAPNDMNVLLRRLYEHWDVHGDENALLLRKDILGSLEIEEL